MKIQQENIPECPKIRKFVNIFFRELFQLKGIYISYSTVVL